MSRSPDQPEGIELPPHAYVPGRNTRHPDDWFDAIKASVTTDFPPDALNQTAAWKAGIVYFDAGYYWECHEVLEAVWMQAPDPSPERAMTQALIQLANARLKLRMERPRASLRLCSMVESHLALCPHSAMILGLRRADIAAAVHATRDSAIRCNIAH